MCPGIHVHLNGLKLGVDMIYLCDSNSQLLKDAVCIGHCNYSYTFMIKQLSNCKRCINLSQIYNADLKIVMVLIQHIYLVLI